jgi:hypothetical protein
MREETAVLAASKGAGRAAPVSPRWPSSAPPAAPPRPPRAPPGAAPARPAARRRPGKTKGRWWWWLFSPLVSSPSYIRFNQCRSTAALSPGLCPSPTSQTQLLISRPRAWPAHRPRTSAPSSLFILISDSFFSSWRPCHLAASSAGTKRSLSAARASRSAAVSSSCWARDLGAVVGCWRWSVVQSVVAVGKYHNVLRGRDATHARRWETHD